MACLLILTLDSATSHARRIGDWTLACPSRGACSMRLAHPLLETSGVSVELQVQAIGQDLVPVVTVLGMTRQMLIAAAVAGSAEARIQLSGTPSEALRCAASFTAYLCAPDGEAAKRLAAALPRARAATIQAVVTLATTRPLPMRRKTVSLAGTAQALRRLRALGPIQLAPRLPALPPDAPAGLMAIADSALKAAGYPNGVATLREIMARYLRTHPE